MIFDSPFPQLKNPVTFIFGASFNPVHNGHLFLAQQLAAEDWIKEVVFLPCGEKHAFGKNLAPATDRVKMLELAIQGHEKMKISLQEIEQEGTSYTYETLQKWRQLHPGEDFVFNLGSDSVKDIEKWYKYEQLLAEFDFLVTRRPGKKIDYEKLAQWPRIKTWELKKKPTMISSTKIRQLIRSGQEIKNLVPLPVAEYIITKKLYQE